MSTGTRTRSFVTLAVAGFLFTTLPSFVSCSAVAQKLIKPNSKILTTRAGQHQELAHPKTPAAVSNKKVTFNQDIAPIIHTKCSSCHRPGQSGPFSLLTYQDVSSRSRTLQAVIDSGYMPPWKPVHQEGVFSNERQLSKQEIEKIRQWTQHGTPEGQGPSPSPPEFPNGWKLGEPDLVIAMPNAFNVPANGPDIYRSFVFPLQLPEDKWIKAIEYRPTATSSVHHAIFLLDESGNARKLDGSDGQPGIEGMNFLGGGLSQNIKEKMGNLNPRKVQQDTPVNNALGRSLGAYVPGWTPARLPRDLALKLPQGSDIVMQTHFHPSGKKEQEQGQIAIYFADVPPSQLIVPIQVPPMFGVTTGLKVPPGEKNYVIQDSFQLPVDVELVSVGAHAHYICREIKMTAQWPDGTRQRLLQIDDWDLDWQDRYYFKDRIRLPAGTVLTSKLVYDNSSDNPENPNDPPKEIRWGRESGDEMGSVNLQVVAVDENSRPSLESAIHKHFLQSISKGSLVDLLMQLDTNRDGGLQKKEAPPGMAKRFNLLDRNRDGKLDPNELQIVNRFFNRGGRR